MNRRSRPRILLGVLAALSAVLTSCFATVANASAAAPVTVQMALQPAPPATEAIYNGWVSGFEKTHPNVTVKIDYIPAAQYASTVLTELQGGGGPDLIFTDAGSGETYSTLPLSKSGKLANLRTQPWAKQIPASSRALLGTKGNIYAYPEPATAAGLVFNQTLLNSLGAKVPTTFKELLSVCATAKAHGVPAIEVAGTNAENTGLLGEIIASSYVYSSQPSWNTLRGSHKVTFAGTKRWNQALSTIGELTRAGCFETGAAGQNTTQAEAAVAQGHALMYTAPGLVAGILKGINPADDFAVMAFPGPAAADTRATIGFSGAIGVNVNSKAKKPSIQFLDYVAADKQSINAYAQTQSGLTLQQLHQGDVANVPALQPMGAYVKGGKLVPLANSTWASAQVFDDFGTGITGLLTGQTSPKTILQQMDSDWNEG